jgi:hypothetical protein
LSEPSVINLSSVTPAAPTDTINVEFQADSNNPRNVSAYVTAATGSSLGIVKPDGTTITVDSHGVITSAGSTPTIPLVLVTPTSTSNALILEGSIGPPTFVQAEVAFYSPGPATTCAFTSPNTAGNLLLIFIWYQYTGLAPSSVTDSAGNTYTLLASYTSGNPIYCYVCTSCVAYTGNTVTITAGISTYTSIAIAEYAAAAVPSVLDTHAAGNTSPGSGGLQTFGSVTTTAVEEVIISFIGLGSFAASPTAGPAYTSRATGGSMNLADQNAATIGTYVVNWSASGWPAVGWMAVVIKRNTALGQRADLQINKSPAGTLLSAIDQFGRTVSAITSGVPVDSPQTGTTTFDPVSNTLWMYNGTNWVSVILTYGGDSVLVNGVGVEQGVSVSGTFIGTQVYINGTPV